MTDDLAAVITNLSEPPAPASLKATVMARIAREFDERQSASPAPARSQRDTFVWIAAFAGFAVVAAAVAYELLEAGSLPSGMSPRIGLASISLIPAGPSTLVVGLGLLVYLAGLFGPLRSGFRK